MMRLKPELLSPAGGWEAMLAGVQNGADAVYLGGSRFSARAGAANFDDIQIERAIDYCHLRGVKVFVALNTLLKPAELTEAADYAAFLYQIGADALIIQDLGLAAMLRKTVPDLPLHASTQMTVHNSAGAAALEKMGFRRIVLARELTREQIAQIRSGTKLELEVFVHGALCYCYSGQCLFSSMLGGRSGNRGRCAQPCRLPYELLAKEGQSIKSGHLLSPKDLCLLTKVHEMAKLGVDSLKIEGRLKRPEYVATVTQIYRKYIDTPASPTREDIQVLQDAFNRSGFTMGFYGGQPGEKMMSYRTPSNVAPETFPKGIERTFHPDANLRKAPVRAKCRIIKDKPMELCLWDESGNQATAYGEIPLSAPIRPMDPERAERQLSKFGSTPFELLDVALEMDDGLSVSVAALNALRRDAVQKLSDARVMRAKREGYAASVGWIGSGGRENVCDKAVFSAQVQTIAQAKAVMPFVTRIYAPIGIAAQLQREADGCEVVSALPDILTDENMKLCERIETESVMTGIFGLGEALGKKRRVYGGFRLNLYNAWAARTCLENGFDTVTLSPELTLGEMAQLAKEIGQEAQVIVYGHLPLMIIKNCVIKAGSGKCGKGTRDYYLKDRKGERLPLLCEPNTCTNLLLNAKPLYMADKLGELTRRGLLQLQMSFTIESPEQCARIMQAYMDAAKGKAPEPLFLNNEFTRGHFYHGVQ